MHAAVVGGGDVSTSSNGEDNIHACSQQKSQMEATVEATRGTVGQ